MIKSKKVTLKEVAAAVNLAVPTVSQILNGRKNYCSKEMCEKVRETARQMGYITNLGYRIMTGQETHIAGIMVACIEHMQEDHYRTTVLNLLKIFASRGCSAFCHILSSDGDQAFKEVQEYIGRGVERFVFLGQPFGSDDIFEMLKKLNIPFIGNTTAFERYVIADAYSGRRELFRDLNHKTDGKFRIFWWENSLNLFRKIFDSESDYGFYLEHWQDIPKCGEPYYESTFRIGYDMMAQLLENEPEIRGAAFPNDAFALGGARCLLDRKISGFHISGCNGDRELLRFPYPVSTAIFDLEKLAGLLAERVFDNEKCKISVPTKLRLVP